MWRKIRRFYWYRRDRGLGKQTIAMAVMFLLMVFILAGVIAKSVVPQKDLRNEAEIPANTATGPAVNTSTARMTCAGKIIFVLFAFWKPAAGLMTIACAFNVMMKT